MLRNILFAAAVAAIVAPLAMTAEAMPGSSTSPETGKQHAHLGAHSVPQHRRQGIAHWTFARGFG
jgi:hypothetical protein